MKKYRNIVQRTLAVAMSLSLMGASPAFAAPQLLVSDWGQSYTEYSEEASGTDGAGGTWAWGGPDGGLVFDNFQGSNYDFIGLGGPLTAVFNGDNAIFAIGSDGNLSLFGNDGATVTIGDGTGTSQVSANDGGVQIRNLDMTLDNAHIQATHGVSIQNSDIEGYTAPFAVDAPDISFPVIEVYGEGYDGYGLTIVNSNIHVANDNPEDSYPAIVVHPDDIDDSLDPSEVIHLEGVEGDINPYIGSVSGVQYVSLMGDDENPNDIYIHRPGEPEVPQPIEIPANGGAPATDTPQVVNPAPVASNAPAAESVQPVASASASAASLPKTGDSTSNTVALAMGVAGSAVLAAGGFALRKRQSA